MKTEPAEWAANDQDLRDWQEGQDVARDLELQAEGVRRVNLDDPPVGSLITGYPDSEGQPLRLQGLRMLGPKLPG